MWCIPCLMMAGGLLAADQLGGGGTLEQWMQQLAGNSGFVQAALSSEIGAPGWESVSEHAPQAGWRVGNCRGTGAAGKHDGRRKL